MTWRIRLGVGHHHRWLGGMQRDRTAGVGGAGVLGGFGRDAGQVDGRLVEGAAGVVVREQEQVFDELAHAAGFALDHSHEPQQFAAVGVVALLQAVFGEPADGGEGCAQLVAGVGGELPHPGLRAPGLFFPAGACLVGRLDGGEHGVQRAGKPPDLVLSDGWSMRRVRSPSAMAAAVVSISASGDRLARTSGRPVAASSTTAIAPARVSAIFRRVTVLSRSPRL